MLSVDAIAYGNRWRRRHPAEKVMPLLGLLLLTTVAPPWPTAVVVAVSTSAAAVFAAGVPWRRWAAALSWPAGFVVAGVIAIALSWGNGPGPLPLTVTADGVRTALETLARSLAGVSLVLLIGVTTPMVDVIALLRRWGVPDVVTDLMSSMYRLVFDLLGSGARMRVAQAGRLGHDGFARSLRSSALVVTAVFRHSIHRSRRLQLGLDARAYDGRVTTLTTAAPLSPVAIAFGIAVVATVGLMAAVSAQ